MSDNGKIHISDVSDLFTDKLANDGIKFPIKTVDGKETDAWLILRSFDSEAFEREALANARNQKELARVQSDGVPAYTDEQKHEAKKEADRKLTASMVAGWSFDKPCTQEAVLDLLRRAKYLADDIDRIAFNRQVFYAGVSSNLPGTPKASTGSTDPQQKDPPSP